MQTHMPDIALPKRFAIRRFLARGGMGSVWLARDRVLGRPVAIKVLDAGLAADRRMAARFRREARTTAALSNHPNVVTIFDVDWIQGRPYIVMDYLAGGSLAAALRRGRPRLGEALAWLGGAASALDHAHQQGIVHRDVKPQNLLLNERRDLAVADFGIARAAGNAELTATGVVVGTAGYAAPEQALGRPAGPASDRYSLAVVAFRVLTGERPFVLEPESPAARLRQHVHATPEPASSRAPLPEAVDPVLERGMAKDPDERWPTATAMVDALHAAVNDELNPPPSARRRLR
jgi:serine/threonine protein kinase